MVVTLTPEEFAQPDGVRLPAHALLKGVKDKDGRVVARACVISLPHIEGTWVSPGHQIAGFYVLGAIEEAVKDAGASHAMAFAPNQNPKIAEYLQRLGYEQVPVTLWMKGVKCQ